MNAQVRGFIALAGASGSSVNRRDLGLDEQTNTPGDKSGGAPRTTALVRVTVMMTVVVVLLLGRLFHDGRLGGAGLQTCAPLIVVCVSRVTDATKSPECQLVALQGSNATSPRLDTR